MPVDYTLAQNYPNPFNPSTTIQYAVPHRSYVTFTVFNTLGQKVADLVNGEINAGYHEVQFNASDVRVAYTTIASKREISSRQRNW